MKAKARLRLEMAADRMAKRLLGLADNAESEAVALAATRDALDRSGLAAKTAVSVEVGVKPFEMVFDAISSGPRDPATQPALAAIESPGEPDVVIGEIDEDPLPEDGEIQRERDIEDAIDVEVEIVADDYTDAESMGGSPGTTTPDQDQTGLSVDPGLTPGPLGLTGPVGSGLMTLQDAVEAAAVMRSRTNTRSARRR